MRKRAVRPQKKKLTPAPLEIWIVFKAQSDPYESDYTIFDSEEEAIRRVHAEPNATLYVGRQA